MLSFKEFQDWCNQRACDGRWGFAEAVVCCDIMKQVNSVPKYRFKKRKQMWEELEPTANEILTKTNEKIKEVDNSDGY